MRTFGQLSKDTGIPKRSLYKRFEAMKLTRYYDERGYMVVTDEQAKLICRFEIKKNMEIDILHLFLSLDDNRDSVIAERLAMNQGHVSKVIRDYFSGKLGYVLLGSKMNANA